MIHAHSLLRRSQRSADPDRAIYVDLYHNGLIRTRQAMADHLGRMNIAQHHHESLLGATDTASLLLRSARNIFNGVQMAGGIARTTSSEMVMTSVYAAMATQIILQNNAPLMPDVLAIDSGAFEADAQFLQHELYMDRSDAPAMRMQTLANQYAAADRAGPVIRRRHQPDPVTHRVSYFSRL